MISFSTSFKEQRESFLNILNILFFDKYNEAEL